jgi:hypothetical protein
MVKLKRKIILTKKLNKIKRIRTTLEKFTYHKLRLNDEFENKSRFYKISNNKY